MYLRLYVRLHARKPPLDDIRVRRAIAHAVDVDLIISAICGGLARRITGPYPSEVFGYDPDAPLPTYDPELATSRADVPALWLALLDDLCAARPNIDWQPCADSLVWLRGSATRSS